MHKDRWPIAHDVRDEKPCSVVVYKEGRITIIIVNKLVSVWRSQNTALINNLYIIHIYHFFNTDFERMYEFRRIANVNFH